MFEIRFNEQGAVVLEGRLDAAQTARAMEFFDRLTESSVVDCRGLEYISSAGLGVLLKTQKRLMAVKGELILLNLNNHIHDVFHYASLDKVFKIQKGGQ
jgi:anti-sigma B factor antagonist